MDVKWLEWARRIQALSKSGLTFSKDAFDIERYKELEQISAEIIASYSDLDVNETIALFSKEKGYQTPKVDVRGAVFQDQQILLVQEKSDGNWSLPGGFCDVGLSAAENIVKEIEEEAGYKTEARNLMALIDMNKHAHPPQPFHYYKVFIQCEVIEKVEADRLETTQAQFFPKDRLPRLSTNRNTEEQIASLFAFYHSEDKRAIFD
ncbi:NUDIX hydrolase [Alkalihalobacillus pseudalcaliphilus]|uniref:NUDIX hydrolase n=1 Tax=Alkalihalobacillus pseudalcaliphilus TaxID=79884 RepID=UPI00064DA323|nr:NUDIX hydrolase [Alkalihalobacillus pseudalcaliphilus]KMK78115.1 ADP-ribose pyrophosphatase [Alkalihalobacillus pseudalcaliphilus]